MPLLTCVYVKAHYAVAKHGIVVAEAWRDRCGLGLHRVQVTFSTGEVYRDDDVEGHQFGTGLLYKAARLAADKRSEERKESK